MASRRRVKGFARALTNNNFVIAAYETVLNRTPDPGGLRAWSQALADGASYYSVAFDLIQSPESAQDIVEAMYEKYLLRSADPGGLAAFTTFLLQGGTPEQAVAIMVGSEEYFALV
jgi:hypothetical protein